jgi:hypothetical protein
MGEKGRRRFDQVMNQLFRGLALQWPAAALEQLVPNV